ncbi:hypothetical protein [Streptomyces sp. NPDC048248]|uniref:hypothetical protein n=1 Tax=Streptomyces sp. NPDC048248 TaxID=3365523 RepID=UPI0037127EA5
MTNFAITVGAGKVTVTFTDVSSDEDRSKIGKFVLSLAIQEKELTVASGSGYETSVSEYHVRYPHNGSVTREYQRLLAERIHEQIPGIIEAGG